MQATESTWKRDLWHLLPVALSLHNKFDWIRSGVSAGFTKWPAQTQNAVGGPRNVVWLRPAFNTLILASAINLTLTCWLFLLKALHVINSQARPKWQRVSTEADRFSGRIKFIDLIHDSHLFFNKQLLGQLWNLFKLSCLTRWCVCNSSKERM